MTHLKLVIPTEVLEAEALAYKQAHFDHQEFELHGGAFLDKITSYSEWLQQLKNNSSEKTVHPNLVVASTFFAVRQHDNKIIGMIDIRHTLNDYLRNYGGHIGYGVHPLERNKGYSSEILTLGLAYCDHLGLKKVMLTCNKDNIASRKTIIKNGGQLEKECVHANGKTIQIFWITRPSR